MRLFADKHRLKDYSVTARSGINEIHEIIAFATEMKADIVAMATHDRNGLERLFGGIISGGVINEIDIPVWTKAIPYSDRLFSLLGEANPRINTGTVSP